ncbi:MAG: ATP phosphoribosyltransferase regulatory subunit, partial [Candidatus Heimdallarchaeaceae archaeon]
MDSGEIKEILKGIKGFRDYYPEDYADIKFILETMSQVSERFGYEEYEGPSLEYAKLIEIKSGQALMEETFIVIGKDKRKLVLRPEQTPTLARMIVNEQQRYPKPIRWYSIPRIFRNETPQKGRVREFFQFNADIIGVDHPAADAEIIALTTQIIKRAGLKDGEFVCVINSRELVQNYIEYIGADNYIDVIKVMDAKEKYLQEYIIENLTKKGVKKGNAKEIATKIRMIWQQDPDLTKDYTNLLEDELYSEYLASLSDIVKNILISTLVKKGLDEEQAEKIYEFSQISGSPDDFLKRIRKIDLGSKAFNALEKLEQLSSFLSYFGVIQNCVYDASIARGLDYYTGIVFEFEDRTGSVVRAIAGGGRYDQLVSMFGGEKIPATGIGMGETVLMTILKELGRLNKYRQKT